MVTVDGGVEEVVDSLLERGEHQHRLLHLRQPEPRDPQHLPKTFCFFIRCTVRVDARISIVDLIDTECRMRNARLYTMKSGNTE